MLESSVEKIKYPIGRFEWDNNITRNKLEQQILNFAKIPAGLRSAVNGLTDEQMDMPYRENGWTIRQIINHLADSSILGFTLYKYALTEKEPCLKHYDCTAWGETEETRLTPLKTSLALIDSLYEKWIILLQSMDEKMWSSIVAHEYLGKNSLRNLLHVYEWHGRHHIAQIITFRKRMGWIC